MNLNAFTLIYFIILFISIPAIECKKQKNGVNTLESTTSANRDEDVDTIVFTDEADKLKKINELKQKTLEDRRDKARVEKAKLKLESDEISLKKGVMRAVLNHGDDSKEKAIALHKLGRNLYQQDRFDEAFEMSFEISRIHSVIDGKDSLAYADALGNVGSVANRMNDKRLCEAVMKRQLRILLDHHGSESKEVLIQRARMLSFRIQDGETSEGMGQETYEKEMEGIDATNKEELDLIEGDL